MAKNEELIIILAKVIIAAAWADGKITNDEINHLKDLMFRMPNMTRLQWAELDMYIETPVDDAERERLIEELRRQVSGSDDRQLALDTLLAMIEADGDVSDDEQAMMDTVKEVLTDSGAVMFNSIKRLVTGSIDERAERIAEAPNRDAYYHDFITNKVYYEVQRRLRMGETELNIDDNKLRKLSLAGGLMAQIARVHQGINDDELQAIAESLEKHWQLPRTESAFVAQVATSELAENIDYMRTAREFYDVCDNQEILDFVDILFEVAASDGIATMSEIEEIRAVSKSLLVNHDQFIEAKIKIPRDKREV